MKQKHIVVVGGGTAGWMCAAALCNQYHADEVRVSLVESDRIGTVGVGEATIPFLRFFNQRLGINEKEFIRATNATYKLGIEFINWAPTPGSYFHPFGDFGSEINGRDFYSCWLSYKLKYPDAVFGKCSVAATAALNGKFAYPNPTWRDWRGYAYAFHLDAVQYALFLRDYSEARGVERLEGVIEAVELDELGNISCLYLKEKNPIKGDIFIDCSGFRSLLLGEALNVPFEDWGRWLPCDRAIAIPSESDGILKPYTQAEAIFAGWRWEIPLQNRTGNGLVYSSAHMSDDEAQFYLQNKLSRDALAAANNIRFKAGRRRQSWVRNCLAIGLSSGFLEPLESTSIYLIQMGIMKFIDLFSPVGVNESARNEYNAILALEYERVRDFIIAHYHTAQRYDSEFWRYCSTMELPDSLNDRLNIYKSIGVIDSYQIGLFKTPSWASLLLGQQYNPHKDCLNDKEVDEQELADRISKIERNVTDFVGAMSSHKQFLNEMGGEMHVPPSGLNFYGVFC